MKYLTRVLLALTAASTLMADPKLEKLPASDLGQMLELELEALLLPKKNGELDLIQPVRYQ